MHSRPRAIFLFHLNPLHTHTVSLCTHNYLTLLLYSINNIYSTYILLNPFSYIHGKPQLTTISYIYIYIYIYKTFLCLSPNHAQFNHCPYSKTKWILRHTLTLRTCTFIYLHTVTNSQPMIFTHPHTAFMYIHISTLTVTHTHMDSELTWLTANLLTATYTQQAHTPSRCCSSTYMFIYIYFMLLYSHFQ